MHVASDKQAFSGRLGQQRGQCEARVWEEGRKDRDASGQRDLIGSDIVHGSIGSVRGELVHVLKQHLEDLLGMAQRKYQVDKPSIRLLVSRIWRFVRLPNVFWHGLSHRGAYRCRRAWPVR